MFWESLLCPKAAAPVQVRGSCMLRLLLPPASKGTGASNFCSALLQNGGGPEQQSNAYPSHFPCIMSMEVPEHGCANLCAASAKPSAGMVFGMM